MMAAFNIADTVTINIEVPLLSLLASAQKYYLGAISLLIPYRSNFAILG